MNFEAIDALEAAFHAHSSKRDWKEAAIDADSLAEVYLTVGRIEEATKVAHSGVIYADRTSDFNLQSDNRSILGHVLHQEGHFTEAREKFEEAQRILREKEPNTEIHKSYRGFLFLDLMCDIGEHCKALDHARMFLKTQSSKEPALRVALNYLVMARAMILGSKNNLKSFAEAAKFIDLAIEWLRRAGRRQDMPRALLTRAFISVARKQQNQARADIDEAQQIAERGHMRLHLADIHLHRARLFHDFEELKRARELIEQCGYWRRKQELEDAERRAKRS